MEVGQHGVARERVALAQHTNRRIRLEHLHRAPLWIHHPHHLHPRPTDGAPHPYWQFHIEFYPPYRTRDKLKYLAGSESGAGVFINDTLPEETAQALRAIAVSL